MAKNNNKIIISILFNSKLSLGEPNLFVQAVAMFDNETSKSKNIKVYVRKNKQKKAPKNLINENEHERVTLHKERIKS